MRRANIIEKDITSIGTLKNLTNVFESLASNQVAKVKHRAGLGHEFFQMIWKYYTAIRVDPIGFSMGTDPGFFYGNDSA